MKVEGSRIRLCPVCSLRPEMVPSEFVRKLRLHGKTVKVKMLTSLCPSCGTQATSSIQHSENLSRLKAVKDNQEVTLRQPGQSGNLDRCVIHHLEPVSTCDHR